MVLLDKALIKHGNIEQAPQRHIGIPAALVLIEVHHIVNQKGHIILAAHVQDVLDGGHNQLLRVIVVRAIDGIVKA